MIKQNWEVSEEEKRRVLSLHENATKNLYLIKEQKSTDKEVKKFDLTKSFSSGEYKLNNTQELDKIVSEIQNFLKSNPNTKYDVVITASESKVPNRGVGMKPGDLSQTRLAQVLNYVQPKLSGVDIKTNPLPPGGLKWDPKKGADHPDYTKHQFVNMSVVLPGAKGKQVPVAKCGETYGAERTIGETGEKSDGYVTFNRTFNTPTQLIFSSYRVPDRIRLFDENDVELYDSGYYANSFYDSKLNVKYGPILSLNLANKYKTDGGMVMSKKNPIVKLKTKDEVIEFFEIPKTIHPSKVPFYENILKKPEIFDVVKYTVGQTLKINTSDYGENVRVVITSPLKNTNWKLVTKCI